jgi:hypothetical protein
MRAIIHQQPNTVSMLMRSLEAGVLSARGRAAQHNEGQSPTDRDIHHAADRERDHRADRRCNGEQKANGIVRRS